MNKSIFKTLRKLAMGAMLCLSVYAVSGCTDTIADENRFTFTGELISDHLENNPEKFSMFCEILKKANIGKKASGNMFRTLSTYGSYTCFAPTNEAIDAFMLEEFEKGNITSSNIEDLSVEKATEIANNHIIEMGYRTIDINEGVFPQVTMNRRVIPVDWKNADNGEVNIILEGKSKILSADIETENGYVQVIDRVLNPSNNLLPDQIKQHAEFSIFYDAIIATKLDTLLNKHILDPNYDGLRYLPKPIKVETDAPYPEEFHQKYTVLIETNSLLNANGVHNIDDLYEKFAKPHYGGEAEGDYSNPANALYKYIAYHIIDRQLHYSSSTGPGGFIMENYRNNGFDSEVNLPTAFDRTDYFETMLPYTMIKVTRPFTNTEYKDDIVLNYAQDNGEANIETNMENHINVKVLRAANAGVNEFDPNATNGTIHVLNKILIYNEREMAGNILHERIRIDVSSLFPELTNNGVRWAQNTKYTLTYIPNDYCKRLVINSVDSHVLYLRPHVTYSGGYPNYMGDELLVLGRYDFQYRIPYVPEGDYEIRFGYSQSDLRGICQFYLDNKICGIPVNMKQGSETEALIGWFDEEKMSDEEILQNDKAMRNRGYMKGPASCIVDKENNGSMRDSKIAIRKIIGTFRLSKDKDHWLRFKNVTENSDGTDQFNQDYLEIVPIEIINDQRKPEDQY